MGFIDIRRYKAKSLGITICQPIRRLLINLIKKQQKLGTLINLRKNKSTLTKFEINEKTWKSDIISS